MKTLDRYIARQFLMNLVIIFVVFTALYVLLDMINQFDEFIQAAQVQEGGPWDRIVQTVRIAGDYYWPTVFLMYSFMVGLLPIAAAGFTLTTLLRNREIIAMLAGGVSLYRIAMPVFALGFVLNVLMVANQEFVLPHLANKLSRKATDLRYQGQTKRIPLRFVPDGNGTLFSASDFDVELEQMTNVTILPRARTADPQTGAPIAGQASARITAEQAVWDPDRGGWELIGGMGVRRDLNATDDDPDASAGQEIIGVDFLPSDLDPATIKLRERSRYRQLLSTRQLNELVAKAQQSGVLDVNELLRIRHSRFSVLVMNMLILAMGLSYFLLRAPQNMFIAVIKATVVCVGAWAGGLITLQIGAGSLPPAAIAWLPVALYLPSAYWLMDSVET